MHTKLFIFILCGLFTCCSEVSYVDGKYAPVPYSHVEVVSLSQLQKPYEIIGEYTGNPVLQNFKKWKQKAANLGGDAMTLPERQHNGYVKFYVIKWK